MERRERAAEAMMRRRTGGSKRHAEHVKQTMLAQADLRTECPRCHHRRVGTYEQVIGACPECGYGS